MQATILPGKFPNDPWSNYWLWLIVFGKCFPLVKILRYNEGFRRFLKKATKVYGVGINIFWCVTAYIFWKFIQYTVHWDKTKMLKKFPSDKINVRKMYSFFFLEIRLNTVLLLIHNFCTSWITKLSSLKLSGIFHFQFSLVFMKVYNFVQQKACTLLPLN